jgi:hypothetical protein
MSNLSLPDGALTYDSTVAPVQFTVTNELVAYAVEAYNGKPYVQAGCLQTGTLATVDTTNFIGFYFYAAGQHVLPLSTSPAPVFFTPTPANAVLPVYYSGALAGMQVAEVIIRFVDHVWHCRVVPCNFSSLGFALNSFGVAPVLPGGVALVANVPFSIATAPGTYLSFAGGKFTAGTSPAAFSFVAFPEIGGRCMLCDAATGNVLAPSADYSSIVSVAPGTWRASTPPFQQWGFLAVAAASATLQAVLVHQAGDSPPRALAAWLSIWQLLPTTGVLTLEAPPGLATKTGAPSPYVTLAAVVPASAEACAARTQYGCAPGMVHCATATTAAGAAACAGVTAADSSAAGVPDPRAQPGTIVLASYLQAGSVAVRPTARTLTPGASITYTAIGFPFSFTLTVTLPAEQQALLSVDPITVTVDTASAVVDVPYSADCDYYYKTYAQVITAYDAEAQTATVTLRPYAPGTNGFVENSFGTPRPGYAGGRQGFFYNSSIALVPYAEFNLYASGSGGYLSAVGGAFSDTPAVYTYMTIASTRRQQLEQLQAGTAPAALLPRQMWGALQIWNAGVGSASGSVSSGNVLLYYDGTFSPPTVQYVGAKGVLAPLPQGTTAYANPPGFLTIDDTGLQFMLDTTTNALLPAAICWAQNLYGCPGNAPMCRFGSTDAGEYYCADVLPPSAYRTDVCAKVYNAGGKTEVDCRDVAGMGVTQCSGWNSDNFGAACKQLCAGDSSCDTAMKNMCAVNPALPDCACINVENSSFPVALRGGVSYPEYRCGLANTIQESMVGVTSLDFKPSCWWPTCSLGDGAYVPLSLSSASLRATSCPSTFSACFNLISDIHAMPKNLQISAVNKTGCGGSDWPTLAAASVCPAAEHSSAFLKPPRPGQPPAAPPPPPTVYNIDKYFTNTDDAQNVAFRRDTNPKPIVTYAPLDVVAYAIIGGSALLFIILVLVLMRTSFLLKQKSDA